MILEITDNNLNNTLTVSKGLVMIDFWSPWCRPCNMLNPIVKGLAEKNSDVVIGKLNTVENPGMTAHFKVSAIPTILFFKGGHIVERLMGYQTEAKLQKHIDDLKNLNFLYCPESGIK